MDLVDKVAELILWISGWVILGMAVIEGSHLIKKIMKRKGHMKQLKSNKAPFYIVYSKKENKYLMSTSEGLVFGPADMIGWAWHMTADTANKVLETFEENGYSHLQLEIHTHAIPRQQTKLNLMGVYGVSII